MVPPPGAYAELTHTRPAGLQAPSVAAVPSDKPEVGLRFSVNTPITLVSVDIHVVEKGLYQFNLYDRQDQLIKNFSKVITNTGPYRLVMFQDLAPQTDYRLVMATGKALLSEDSGVTYPFADHEALVIEGAIGTDEEHVYPYFYHWELEWLDPCGRQFGNAAIAPAPGLAPLTIEGPDVLSVGQTASYVSSLIDPLEVQWLWQDSVFAYTPEVQVTPQSAGSKQLGVWIMQEDSCAVMERLFIEVQPSVAQEDIPGEGTNWRIYPNPVQGRLTVDMGNQRSDGTVHCQWLDARAVPILPEMTEQLGSNPFTLDTPPSSGLYLLRIRHQQHVAMFRVIVP